jgi:hypothetical protein
MDPAPTKHVNGRLWPPGVSGNPNGRAVGSRTAFSAGFLKDLADFWQEHGKDPLALTSKASDAAPLFRDHSLPVNWINILATDVPIIFGDESPQPDAAKAQVYFERALNRPPTTSQILGTPGRNESGTPLAQPGQGAASSRTARSGLPLVYGRFRHARSEGGEGAAGGDGGVTVS